MDWYVVVKTIKGRRYRYRQRTWRENGRMRTESQYLGPVDGGAPRGRPKGSKNVSTTPPAEPAGAGSTVPLCTEGEDALIEYLLSGLLTFQWTPAYSWEREAKAGGRQSDPEIWDLGLRMGVSMTTQMWPMPGKKNCPVYKSEEHRISIPDLGRYLGDVEQAGREAGVDLLHELVHSTMKTLKRPKAFLSELLYAREELVAEIGANIIVRRLGVEPDSQARSRVYVVGWAREINDGGFWEEGSDDPDGDIAWAVEEAKRAADYILSFHSRGGWMEKS